MSLAQIGEFAFVLLSRASNLRIIEVGVFAGYFSCQLSDLCFKSDQITEV